MHAGDLDYKGKQKEHILDILKRVPTVVDIYLDRPAVIPEIAEKCAGLVSNFGAEDAAVLDVIFGKFIQVESCHSKCHPQWKQYVSRKRMCHITRRIRSFHLGMGYVILE